MAVARVLSRYRLWLVAQIDQKSGNRLNKNRIEKILLKKTEKFCVAEKIHDMMGAEDYLI